MNRIIARLPDLSDAFVFRSTIVMCLFAIFLA